MAGSEDPRMDLARLEKGQNRKVTKMKSNSDLQKKMLDLFSGTGTVGKVLEEQGYHVTSLDHDPKFHPTILTDIMEWDYRAEYPLTILMSVFVAPPAHTSVGHVPP